jgi:diadenosine tetraphosphate (Ap4A) HIT family hydrolase
MRFDPADCPICLEIAALPSAGGPPPVAVSLSDADPVTEGHQLVVPTDHVLTLTALSPTQRDSLFARVGQEVRRLEGLPDVDGVNVGINSGVAAGQTVPHLHVHVIPRRHGDCRDPRGGVRRVLDAGGVESDRSGA